MTLLHKDNDDKKDAAAAAAALAPMMASRNNVRKKTLNVGKTLPTASKPVEEKLPDMEDPQAALEYLLRDHPVAFMPHTSDLAPSSKAVLRQITAILNKAEDHVCVVEAWSGHCPYDIDVKKLHTTMRERAQRIVDVLKLMGTKVPLMVEAHVGPVETQPFKRPCILFTMYDQGPLSTKFSAWRMKLPGAPSETEMKTYSELMEILRQQRKLVSRAQEIVGEEERAVVEQPNDHHLKHLCCSMGPHGMYCITY